MVVGTKSPEPRTARAVVDELDRFFSSKIRDAETRGIWLAQLWESAHRCARGGKLVRPRIFLSMVEALRAGTVSSSDPDALQDARVQETRIATALELLHYSFLLHDDVIDGDLVRRGEPNLIGVLAAAPSDPSFAGAPTAPPPDAQQRRLHWARSSAMLLGNLLLSEVHQIFASLETDEASRSRLLGLLDTAITDSVAGEQLDVGLCDGIIPSELGTILEMCRLKTGTYTFELPLRTAAVVAGAPAELEAVLARTGRLLGLAFQLQDDLLSVFGDPALHGKDAFSDIREGKETALVSYARRTSSWARIAPSLGREALDEADARSVAAELEACGARAFVEEAIEETLTRIHREAGPDGDASVPEAVSAVVLGIAVELRGRTS